MQAAQIRIGTRGSPLALAQARETAARLQAAHSLGEADIAIVVIKTSGDRILDRPLAEVGGKGLFTKEIEEALLAREVDIAVHSMKDMATLMPECLAVGAVLPREDVRDALISLKHGSIDAIPRGAVVGTSSLRRQAQLKHRRPDLTVVPFRGNVQTRLAKLQDGVAEATFLACAGLRRLGLADRITAAIATDEMLPAVAQGAIALQIRHDDAVAARLVAPLNDPLTFAAAEAERAFLAVLEGSCRTPIAGLAQFENGALRFRGEILTPDGSCRLQTQRHGPPADANGLAIDAAHELKSRAGPQFFTGLG